MSAPVIEVQGLTKTYGKTKAVDNLEFAVTAGKVTGFLGPNGAGKTTTMRVVLGLVRPTSGEARVLGVPYRQLSHPMHTVGALIDGEGFHPDRTARQHLLNVAAMAGIQADRADDVLAQVEMTQAADQKVGGFSLGMRQRLGLAGALIGDPEILILDEPSNGLDPAGIRWMRSFLRDAAGSGRTVFVSSHALAEMTNLADEVVVINHGKLITHTSVSGLLVGEKTLVGTAEPERMTEALQAAGARVEAKSNDQLVVAGIDAAGIGEVARSMAITLTELTNATPSLEDVFLELTDDGVAHV